MAGTEIGSIFVKIGADVNDLQKGLNDVKKKLNELGAGSDEASDNLKKLANRALIENLQDMSSTLGGISSTIISFGKDIAGAAMQAENFRIAMTTAFQGNQEAADRMLQWAKDFANATPFETNEIVDATIKLKAYGMTAEEIPAKMRLIGDMASGMGKTMDQAVEAIADATTGELERLKEFGITKKMLNDEVNGTLVNSKNQITDMNLLMEALSSIMEKRFAGGMEAASKSTAGQISNLKGEFQGLKEELGQELVPTIETVVKGLSDLVKWVRSIDPEVKSTALTFTAWAGGIALAGQSVTGMAAASAPFVTVLGSMGAKIIIATEGTAALGSSMGALGVALPVVAVGALIIALGTLAAATIEYQRSVIELQQTDLENALKRQADSLRALKEIYPDATTSAIGFQKVIEEGIDKILQQADGLFKLKTVLKSLANDELVHTATLSDARKKLADLQAKDSYYMSEKDQKKLQEQIAEQKQIIKQETEYIAEKRKQKQVIYDAEKAHKKEKEAVKETTEKQKVSKDAMKEYWVQYNSISVNEKKTAKEKIETLKNLLNQYDLNDEQRAKVNKEIQKQEDKIAKEQKKSNKEIQKSYKENWDIFLSNSKVALAAGEISQEEYNQNISNYIKEHSEELKDNEELRLKIETAYYAGVNKLQKEGEKGNKKNSKEYLDRVKKQEKLNEETLKVQTETQAQILENEGKAVEAKKELLKIEEEEMRKKGISEIEITKWKNAEIEKIEQEAAAKKKAKDEKDAKEKADNLKDLGNLFVDVTKESGYSKDNTDGMADAMKKTKEEAQEVLKTMIQINNITAAKGGGTASGLGEFSSASDALANLPGSKSYSGGGSGFGLGRGSTEGMGNLGSSENLGNTGAGNSGNMPGNIGSSENLGNTGAGNSGNMPGNIPSFATPAGSSSASTAISTTNKTNASISFNFGDTNITKNMPQNVVDAGKTLASWAMGVQLRGERS